AGCDGLARPPLDPAIGIAVADVRAEEAALGRRGAEVLDHLRRHAGVVVHVARDEGHAQAALSLVAGKAADDARGHGPPTGEDRAGFPPASVRLALVGLGRA